MYLLLWVRAWLDFFFLFRKLIKNASVGSIFKDFLKDSFPSLKDMCMNEPPEDMSRCRAASLLRPW
jgi:hypothetical protein